MMYKLRIRPALMLATTAITVGAAALSPTPARADDCIEDAWADYNVCLVMYADKWLHKRLCDIAFMMDLVICAKAEVEQ